MADNESAAFFSELTNEIMPCWFYEKKDLRNTASYQDGISPEVEARYRREGARFILDAGTKMGLRFDTCGTGVVYFHRFYMLHSFREFHRYVTGACCLFLAGKVEETPKKCKDIIKICQLLLTPQQFAVFGDDPKEEVMTLERILLQTIKFDLRLEHPYTFLLKFAKILKGDKHKIQKMVQMAWTFINDHLCTTLCLQWEAEIIAVSLMYLASRLSKFDIQDWEGKPLGSRMKWWEWFVEGITMELMEDICHQVLDLYSTSPQKREESPPMIIQRLSNTNSNNSPASNKSPQMSVTKRSRTTPPSPAEPPLKQNRTSSRNDAASSSSSSSSECSSITSTTTTNNNNKRSSGSKQQQQPPPPASSKISPPSSIASTFSNPSGPISTHPAPKQPPPTQQQKPPPPPQQISAPKIGQPIGPITGQGITSKSSNNDSQSIDYGTNSDSFSHYNPYMPSQMYSSSFMSHEGTQNIQSLISQSRPSQVSELHTPAPPPQTGLVNPPTPQYLPPPGPSYQPPPPFPPQPTAPPGYPPASRPYPPPPSSLPPQDTNMYQYPPPGTYPPQPSAGGPPTSGPPPPPPTLPGSYQAPHYPPPLQSGYQPNYPPPPPGPNTAYTDSQGNYKVVNAVTTTTSLYQQPPPHYPPPTGYSAPPPPGTTSPNRPPPNRNSLTLTQQTKLNPNPGLPTVRITGRQNRR